MKKIIALALTLVMAVMLVACSGAVNVDGTWELSKIGGMTLEEYAASLSTEEVAVDPTLLETTYVFDGDKVTITSTVGTFEYDVTSKSNGVEIYVNGTLDSSLILEGDNILKASGDILGNGEVIEIIIEKQ